MTESLKNSYFDLVVCNPTKAGDIVLAEQVCDHLRDSSEKAIAIPRLDAE